MSRVQRVQSLRGFADGYRLRGRRRGYSASPSAQVAHSRKASQRKDNRLWHADRSGNASLGSKLHCTQVLREFWMLDDKPQQRDCLAAGQIGTAPSREALRLEWHCVLRLRLVSALFSLAHVERAIAPPWSRDLNPPLLKRELDADPAMIRLHRLQSPLPPFQSRTFS